jgi:putative membrane-bound dehydrogenase-like protein
MTFRGLVMERRHEDRLVPLAMGLAVLAAGVAGASAPGPDPRSPRDEQAAFSLADPGLTIELVAAEPEVTSPVAIAWDENGALYVAEMIDYPVAPAAGRIRRLEDRDGDGRYEHATVFADGLPFPNGVLPCHGGVLVTAAPNIWFFGDRDGDGRADDKRIVVTGFGEGNTQLRVNGPSFGLDYMIYVANGRSDGEVRAPDDPPARAVSIRRRDLRFRLSARRTIPQPIDLEAIAGFSQFGLAHDDWGNRFPSWNTIPLRHVVFEQQTLDRNPYLAETSCVASILDMADSGRIFSISPAQARFNRESVAFFNASCGPIIERGGLLPEAYRGNAFVCEPLSNVVHRRFLEPAGVTFVARRVEQGREFLASSDPSFRPVNLATGPDGALYIVDMYRELVEHPQFVPEPARGNVDFRRWHERGRIWRVRPRSDRSTGVRNARLGEADTRQLVAFLGHPNAWFRMTAQRLLNERQDRAAAVPLLIGILADKTNPRARLHAIWTLMALDGLSAAILNDLVVDPHAVLREHGLRAAAELERRDSKRLITTATLATLADDPVVRVRLHAALALGDRCRDEPAALAALTRIAAQDADDPWMRLAILSGLGETALPFIAACNQIPLLAGRAQLLAQAAAIIGVRRQVGEMSALLALIASRLDQAPVKLRPEVPIDSMTMLAGFAEGLERSGPSLHVLIKTAVPDLTPQLDRLAPIWGAAKALAVSDRPIADRLVALDVLSRGRPDAAEEVIPGLLAASQPRTIQSAAAISIGRTGRPALAAKTIDLWNDLAVATRRELLSALAGSNLLVEPLITALEGAAIAPAELDASTRDTLARLPESGLKQRALAVLARSAPPARSEALARYQAALKLSGDVGRGAAVFARHCQTCHQRQGQGNRVGPDLSGIAGRAPEALLSDVLDPNRDVAPDYVELAVATRRGQVVSGLLAEETATTLKLRRAEGVEETILRSEIDLVRSTGRSLMPEGLEQSIGLQEMADLIAFLRQGSAQ